MTKVWFYLAVELDESRLQRLSVEQAKPSSITISWQGREVIFHQNRYNRNEINRAFKKQIGKFKSDEEEGKD